MNVLIFGATGMVGQGVLRETLQAADVQRVVGVIVSFQQIDTVASGQPPTARDGARANRDSQGDRPR